MFKLRKSFHIFTYLVLRTTLWKSISPFLDEEIETGKRVTQSYTTSNLQSWIPNLDLPLQIHHPSYHTTRPPQWFIYITHHEFWLRIPIPAKNNILAHKIHIHVFTVEGAESPFISLFKKGVVCSHHTYITFKNTARTLSMPRATYSIGILHFCIPKRRTYLKNQWILSLLGYALESSFTVCSQTGLMKLTD